MTELKFLDPAQTIEDLRKAVEHMRTHPWGQGEDYSKNTGAFCAYGSIRAAVGGIVVQDGHYRTFDIRANFDGTEQPEVAALRDRASNCARAFYRIVGTELTIYNDTEGRTADQVIRTLETVIEALQKDPRRA